MAREGLRKILSKEVAKGKKNEPEVDVLDYVVPSGKRLRLSRFAGGLESSSKEVRVSLKWADDIIACGYNGSFQYDMDMECVGDGSKKLSIVFTNTDSELHMSGWWEGVLIDE